MEYALEAAAILISLLSLFLAWRAWNLAKGETLFQLRLTLMNRAEQARSAWHGLHDDNKDHLNGVRRSPDIDPVRKQELLTWLEQHGEFIANSLKDACAYADATKEKVGGYNAAKCREGLLLLEPELEKLNRLRGQMRVKCSSLFQPES